MSHLRSTHPSMPGTMRGADESTGIETPKRRRGNVPYPADLGVWESVVSSTSGLGVEAAGVVKKWPAGQLEQAISLKHVKIEEKFTIHEVPRPI